jgi:hypothetical protein
MMAKNSECWRGLATCLVILSPLLVGPELGHTLSELCDDWLCPGQFEFLGAAITFTLFARFLSWTPWPRDEKEPGTPAVSP